MFALFSPEEEEEECIIKLGCVLLCLQCFYKEEEKAEEKEEVDEDEEVCGRIDGGENISGILNTLQETLTLVNILQHSPSVPELHRKIICFSPAAKWRPPGRKTKRNYCSHVDKNG